MGKTGTWLRISHVVALVLLMHAANAQQWPSDLWHEGKIVLLSGDTIRGLVKYDLQQDLVQLDVKGQKPEVFTARKVLFFEIFDNTVKKYRHFFALPYNNTTGYRAPVFFELLEEGKMTLLSREFLEYKTYTSSLYYGGSFTRLVLSYKYFFLKENGDIVEFVGNRNDLLDMMRPKDVEVEKFMKSNRLKYDDKYDLAQIISYYNSISGS